MVKISNYKKRANFFMKYLFTEVHQFYLSSKKLTKYQNTVLFKCYCVVLLKYVYQATTNLVRRIFEKSWSLPPLTHYPSPPHNTTPFQNQNFLILSHKSFYKMFALPPYWRVSECHHEYFLFLKFDKTVIYKTTCEWLLH